MPSFVNKPVINVTQAFSSAEKKQARDNIDVYSKSEVDDIASACGGYVVVQELPSVEEANKNKVYLVGPQGSGTDKYEEWVITDDGIAEVWTLIGETSIDLSPYDKIVDAQAREKAINDALTTHKNDAVAHITSAERTSWNGAVSNSHTHSNKTELDKIASGDKAKWDAKQDAISDLATIRSGAAAGATAVQPSSLAKVATSGSYNDLSNKPTIPAAITIDSAMSSTSTNPVQNKVVNSALSEKVSKSGDSMKSPLMGIFPSSRSTVIGNEYNVLLNAKNRGVTFTQSGSGQLTEEGVWALFNGEIVPSYGPSIDIDDPYVLEIDVSSVVGVYTHCQVFSAFGWTCRYWEPIRFKVELYDSNSNKNEWVTIVDYSTQNYSGQNNYGGGSANLFVPFGSGTINPYTKVARGGIFRKIRITIYKGNNSTNRWGISEIYFWYPEAQSVYKGLESFSSTKLATARSLGVNLARTDASTFDGSADQLEIPIKGSLPISNGGTGASTAEQARINLGLGSLATKSSVADADISGTISDTHIASASKWNGKQDALSAMTADFVNGEWDK